MPGAQCTRSLVCDGNKHTSVVTTVTPEITPAFPAQWFYGLLRALPGEPGFLATVICASSRRLDTSVGVSERHDLAVRFGIIRPARCLRA
jgi:hypothetical protein